jgi:hypothetical protein
MRALLRVAPRTLRFSKKCALRAGGSKRDAPKSRDAFEGVTNGRPKFDTSENLGAMAKAPSRIRRVALSR